MTVRTVERAQFGRVFLAGDAAYTMTPYAGKGTAAGLQDVHNLTWKLAAALRSQASPTLLATYSPERQPIGAFFAHLSGAMADARGLLNSAKMQEHGPTLMGLPDYTYRSAAILAADNQLTTPCQRLAPRRPARHAFAPPLARRSARHLHAQLVPGFLSAGG